MKKRIWKYIWLPILITLIAVFGSVAVFNYVNHNTKEDNITFAKSVANTKIIEIANEVETVIDRGELNVKLYEENYNDVDNLFNTCANYIVDNTKYINFIALYDKDGELVNQINDSTGFCNHNILTSKYTKEEFEIIEKDPTIKSYVSKVYEYNGQKFFYILYKVNYLNDDCGYYVITINLNSFLDFVQISALRSLGYEFELQLLYLSNDDGSVISNSISNDNFEFIKSEYKNGKNEVLTLKLYSPTNFEDLSARRLSATLLSIVVIVLLALSINITLILNQSDIYKKETRVDALTHIPNEKTELMWLMDLENNDKPYIIFYIDINNFKEVNDNFGHDAGDEMLQKLARLLSLSVSQDDLVSRIHGDEFSIIMQGYYTKNRALEIQERILSIVNSNINIQGKEIPMSVSMGFAIVPDDTKRYDEAIKIADMRMYQFKKKVKENTTPDIYKKIANS